MSMRMQSGLVWFALFAIACAPDEPPELRTALEHVDVFMGTGGFAYGHGSAFPGALVPNGLVKVGPDTTGPYGGLNFIHYSGYWHGDDEVLGFSHLHMHGTGATDYGILGVMPTDGFDSSMKRGAGRRSKFDKALEVGEPGYYATTLERGGVRVELTATTHAAHHRWAFADSAAPWVVVDLDHHLSGGVVDVAEARLDPESRTVSGRLHHTGGMSRRFGGYDVFFELRTRNAWKSHRTWTEVDEDSDALEVSGTGAGFALEFDAGAPIEMQIAFSFVDARGASHHLRTELPEWNFEETRARARSAWSDRLSSVRVYGGDINDARTFYSALRHTYVMPSKVGDSDGRFRYADAIHSTEGGWTFLNDFSLWDTYRTLHPLYVLTAPDLALDSARSLVAMARASGFFPVWPLATGDADVMIGASADIVLADTFLKGIRDFDFEWAWTTLRSAACDDVAPRAGRGGRNAMRGYLERGWVAAEENGRSVSTTTEYAHDDFALANFARALGHDDDEQRLRARSKGYRELFEPATGFLRAKGLDGIFLNDFDEWSWDHYAEANAWQSLWMAAHDIEGFVSLFGGAEKMVEKLEFFFASAQAEQRQLDDVEDLVTANLPRKYYWPANEPDIQAVFMFAQAGRPDLTQKYLPWLRRTFYSATPEGLPGNDDGGTMSAWFIFSALGFYPLAGSVDYIVGAPLFPKVEIDVQGGVFTVEARDVSLTNVYVKSVTLNGKPLTRPLFTHEVFVAGGRLVFEMTDEPTLWGR